MQTADNLLWLFVWSPPRTHPSFPWLENYFLPFDVTWTVLLLRVFHLTAPTHTRTRRRQAVAIRPKTGPTASSYVFLPCPDWGSTGTSGWKNTEPKPGGPASGPEPNTRDCRTWTSFLSLLQPANIGEISEKHLAFFLASQLSLRTLNDSWISKTCW